MRKLATVRKIDNILPIEGADAIEVAVIDGWKVVIKKGEYNVNDFAVYFEIDSWIPHELAPFLSNGKEPRVFEGISGERLRTIKLRGQISQGLILPVDILNTNEYYNYQDVTEYLGILKYEKPLPAQLTGFAKGNFPIFIPKTDEERIQNLKNELSNWVEYGHNWEVTEKLDGSSMTVYCNFQDDEYKFGVCSRNLELKDTEGNSFWEVAKKYNLKSILPKYAETNKCNIAIQGELVGEGIQGNKYKLIGRDLFVFRIYDITTGTYLNTTECLNICTELGLKHVPILDNTFDLKSHTVDSLLQFAESKSVLNNKTEREGIVFKCYDNDQPHFKVISNKFLIKNTD